MVIEGILTTENTDGSMHVAPIGPHVNPELSSWTLKPFQTSTTFTNLRANGKAVFHVVDDPLLMAAAVLGLCNPMEDGSHIADKHNALEMGELIAAQLRSGVGWVLDLSCRCYALTVDDWDVLAPRAIAFCSCSHQEEKRTFWGWNRARHSILELAILASRIQMLERSLVEEELIRHKLIIEKTAGPRELAAWELLKNHLSQ